MFTESVESILREGRCTPNCLLALNEESKKCNCRCHGAYHGSLADHQVDVKHTAWNWFSTEDITYLRENEYIDLTTHPVSYYEEVYQNVYVGDYGRFGAVIRMPSGTYSIVFDHEGHRATGGYNLWDEVCYFCDLLYANHVSTRFYYPTAPDCGRYYQFAFYMGGIADKHTAMIIHDVILNYIYHCPDITRLKKYISNLEKYYRILHNKNIGIRQKHLLTNELNKDDYHNWKYLLSIASPFKKNLYGTYLMLDAEEI